MKIPARLLKYKPEPGDVLEFETLKGPGDIVVRKVLSDRLHFIDPNGNNDVVSWVIHDGKEWALNACLSIGPK